jgi:integrase
MSSNNTLVVPVELVEGEIIAPGAETPLPAELVAAAKAFQTMARAPSTRRAYHRAWTDFDAWCRQHGRTPLPASPETVAAWLAWKARHAMPGADPGVVPARGSLDKALAAITAVHRAAKVPFDRKDALIAETWRGVARAVARKRPVRKAEPLLRDRLLRMLAGLRPTVNAEARDAALLALGWGGALRRSELIGLDWQQLGSGTGYVALTPDGVKIVLAVSKTAQDQAVEVVIPKADMRPAYDALSAWAERAGLQPGFSVFRPITKGGIIRAGRLTDRSVSRIIKERIRRFARADGESRESAWELAAVFSGHSLRRGYGTTAAEKGVPPHRIQGHMRHKDFGTTSGYIAAGEAWSQSGLKGIFEGEGSAP